MTPRFDIPDDALVVRFGAGTREQFEANVDRSIAAMGISAFSVRAAAGLSVEEIRDEPPPMPHPSYCTCSGAALRDAGFESSKTGGSLHYSVHAADGITDEVWGKLEQLFSTKGTFPP